MLVSRFSLKFCIIALPKFNRCFFNFVGSRLVLTLPIRRMFYSVKFSSGFYSGLFTVIAQAKSWEFCAGIRRSCIALRFNCAGALLFRALAKIMLSHVTCQHIMLRWQDIPVILSFDLSLKLHDYQLPFFSYGNWHHDWALSVCITHGWMLYALFSPWSCLTYRSIRWLHTASEEWLITWTGVLCMSSGKTTYSISVESYNFGVFLF